MLYLISFLEGIITFISPCLLPMLPVYISYFMPVADGTALQDTAKSTVKEQTRKALAQALCFVGGFTLIFCLMGAFAGTLGAFLSNNAFVFNLVAGAIVVFFGVQYLGILPFNIFKGGKSKAHGKSRLPALLSSFIFGMVFSLSWTPCVGAFLGSALVLASQSGSALKGVLMLLFYSLGLGIPFIAAALLLNKLTAAFNFIKKHYKTINIICGIFLIAVGILIMTGLLGRLLSLLSFA